MSTLAQPIRACVISAGACSPSRAVRRSHQPESRIDPKAVIHVLQIHRQDLLDPHDPVAHGVRVDVQPCRRPAEVAIAFQVGRERAQVLRPRCLIGCGQRAKQVLNLSAEAL